MVRLLLWALIFVLIYRLLVWIWKEVIGLSDRMQGTLQSRAGRSPKNDFNGLDIEDADFEEIED